MMAASGSNRTNGLSGRRTWISAAQVAAGDLLAPHQPPPTLALVHLRLSCAPSASRAAAGDQHLDRKGLPMRMWKDDLTGTDHRFSGMTPREAPVVIVPYDPSWLASFEGERRV